jgi:hypothetical protein
MNKVKSSEVLEGFLKDVRTTYKQKTQELGSEDLVMVIKFYNKGTGINNSKRKHSQEMIREQEKKHLEEQETTKQESKELSEKVEKMKVILKNLEDKFNKLREEESKLTKKNDCIKEIPPQELVYKILDAEIEKRSNGVLKFNTIEERIREIKCFKDGPCSSKQQEILSSTLDYFFSIQSIGPNLVEYRKAYIDSRKFSKFVMIVFAKILTNDNVGARKLVNIFEEVTTKLHSNFFMSSARELLYKFDNGLLF